MSAPLPGRGRNLALATLAFTMSFWAWNAIAPMGVYYATELGLSASEKSMLVATPILVGSVGRIVTGALSDRFGGRVMFTVLLIASAPFVVLVAVAGDLRSYPMLIAVGFFLGIAGTTFSVGIPFVNGWYEPARRGFATGVFGAGMGGTALSAFFTPRFVGWFGYTATHLIAASGLLVVAAIVWTWMREAPGWRPHSEPLGPKILGAAKLPVTWALSGLYAVGFGGFVAFSTYLPTFLKDVYDFSLTEAGTRTAGFAIAAVVGRPLGGVLSDRFGPRVVTAGAGLVTIAAVLMLMTTPPLELPAGATMVAVALGLGVAAGSVFSWVAKEAPADKIGAVTGVVGASGGLGGYLPPIVMGATYDEATRSYGIGLGLLVAVQVVAFVFTLLVFRGRRPVGAST